MNIESHSSKIPFLEDDERVFDEDDMLHEDEEMEDYQMDKNTISHTMEARLKRKYGDRDGGKPVFPADVCAVWPPHMKCRLVREMELERKLKQRRLGRVNTRSECVWKRKDECH